MQQIPKVTFYGEHHRTKAYKRIATGAPTIPALEALACLEFVPLDVNRPSAFIDYIRPYLEFQVRMLSVF